MQEQTSFLRSVNIVFDADDPERIGHYQPTSKAVAFLRGVSGLTNGNAFFVIAPYGSGKSIGATYLLHLVENRAEARGTLEAIGDRLSRVEPELGDFALARPTLSGVHGLVLALEGSVLDVGLALRDAAHASLLRLGMNKQAKHVKMMDVAGIKGALEILNFLKENSTRSKGNTHQIDRIVILWDEFGRHVEQLIRSGQPQRLAEIQTLAEYASRSQKLPITFGLLMHQGLLQYATGLSQSMLAEWRKVEGRFEPIQYVDDSRELYRLIARIIHAHKPAELSLLQHDAQIADHTLKVGLMTELESELPELLESAAPLHPAALHILPRLAARAAQHERTLFGFILSSNLSKPITIDDLYDYFTPAMQSDTGVGGTYRKWLETESALSKVDTAQEASAIKAASILELGLSGERNKVTRALLEFALGGGNAPAHVIDGLLKRKLLLHRRRTDQISLWHGTDIDLRSRLEEELARLEGDFDILSLLNKEFRPSAWRPVKYNDEFSIRRFFDCEFIATKDLLSSKDVPGLHRSKADGVIRYVVPENESDRSTAYEAALQCTDPLCIVVVPREMVNIRTTTAELICLTRMQHDEALLSEDPLISTELQQMLDETQSHLHSQLTRLVQPSVDTTWISAGKALETYDRASLLTALSKICEQIFPNTPIINNEMIVRHKPSPQIVNARRKVIMGILEQHGEERLGIEGEFADASVFRTVLINTGLYRKVQNGGEHPYGYAHPEVLKCKNLALVWQAFKDLLAAPQDSPKDLAAFFRMLSLPPYGMRNGVIPILFAAALKAFPSARVLTDENGDYLEDLLPRDIEDICQYPKAYTLNVLKIDAATKRYLLQLGELFGVDARESPDVIRAVYDGIEAWRNQLPPGALETSEIPNDVRQLQQALKHGLSPEKLFFRRLPQFAGVQPTDHDEIIQWATMAKQALTGVVTNYRNQVLATINENLQLLTQASPATGTMERFDVWRQSLPSYVTDEVSGVARAVLVLPLQGFPSDSAFADALAAIVAERTPQRWTDSDLVRFRNKFSDLVSQIEARALALDIHHSTEENRAAVVELYTHRIESLIDNLANIVGPSDARMQLRRILDRSEEA
ncbi:hypothetical protein LRB11_01510 [Ectothiorhodospira haloalkaliphila]|uniref:hypothetical protein n=1 Tax=Ectothiorhodospira haloalkaliphila TaxID=421628 RepID=UPI001EE84CDB|nr:hypothetical protein [Ectothiorhodospira haloalkaliphila]MCG5523607.1 hypothetical protein [Ectothiorhodospira haloalkaliphila]